MKISLITACYNSEATIADAIESAQAQNYKDIEHIIVDGGSTDGTLAKIKQLNPKAKVISEADDGIYDALNKGIRAATGDIVGILHSDDFFAHRECLAIIARAFFDPDVEAAFSDLDYVDKADTRRVVRHWSNGPFTPSKLKYGWMPAHPTLYLRKAAYDRVGLFDKNFYIAADYDFILRYFSQPMGKSVYIPEVLYKMRTGGASNRNLKAVLHKMSEDLHALRRNRVGGLQTLFCKNFSKVGQLIVRKPKATVFKPAALNALQTR